MAEASGYTQCSDWRTLRGEVSNGPVYRTKFATRAPAKPISKDGRGYHGDQVNGPRVVASTHKFDMAGAVLVSICVKAHGGGLNLLSEDPLLRTQNISPFWPVRGRVDHGDEKLVRALAPRAGPRGDRWTAGCRQSAATWGTGPRWHEGSAGRARATRMAGVLWCGWRNSRRERGLTR